MVRAMDDISDVATGNATATEQVRKVKGPSGRRARTSGPGSPSPSPSSCAVQAMARTMFFGPPQ